MYYLIRRVIFGLLISQRRHMAPAAVNGLIMPLATVAFGQDQY